MPSIDRKTFCRWPLLTPSFWLRPSTLATSASEEICLNACAISSAAGLGERASFGRQRRHARKPDLSASSAVSKNETFSAFGVFEEHAGRQKMPVVRTPKKNTPSNSPFFVLTACHRQSSFPKTFFIVKVYTDSENRFYPKTIIQLSGSDSRF